MSLSEISIRRPVFAWMLMAALIVFGGIAFKRLGISQMPDIDFPVVNVSLSLLGAAPEVMEVQVVDPIEDAVMGIEGIRSVQSTSRQGTAQVTIEFELDRNIDTAVEEVQTRVDQVQKNLPTNLDPPVIKKSNPEDQPILWLTVTSDGSKTIAEQMDYTRNVLYDQFTSVEGVGDIAYGGYVDPNLRIWISAPKLEAMQLSAVDVIKSVRVEHVEYPAGRLENDKQEKNVRVLGEAATPDEFAKILILTRSITPNYRPFQLGKVARIEDGLADIRRISRFNGMQTVGLGILKQHGSNAVEVGNAVKKRIEEIKPSLEKGYNLDVRMDSTTFIRDSVNELNFVLIISALLTSVVCYLFLGSWSSTFNVLLSIPTSIVGSFIAIYFFRFTLNTFTLLGLSLAIGIVVDDAIMMLENIVRHMEMGEKRFTAAIRGADEISFAALAATIAIAAIFLPVIFMKGIVGKFLFQYGVTVTVAVMLSLLEALTLTPMRCSRFLEIHTKSRYFGWLTGGVDRLMLRSAKSYEKMLKHCLKVPSLVIGAAILFFALSVAAVKKLPGELVPPQDQSRFLLRLKAKIGSSIDFTNLRFKQVEEVLSKIPEIEGYYSAIGGFNGDTVNEGIVYVNLKDPSQRKLSQQKIMENVRDLLKKKFKDLRVFAQDLSLRGFTSSRGFPVEFTVQGPDLTLLGDSTLKLMDKLKTSGFLSDVNTDYELGIPEVHIIPNRKKAAMHGVVLGDVAQTVNAALGGVLMGSDTRYFKHGHRIDINARLEANERTQIPDIDQLRVMNQYGQLVNLRDVVDVSVSPALPMISRSNRERAITVYANIPAGHSQQDALKKVESTAKEILPSGYRTVFTGNSQTFKESFQSLIFAMILGIFVAYMVLASQFNSFIHPVSVLMALPFSLSGAFMALLLGHQSLNMFSVIGLILLMGIVKKNSILLVDFTNQVRATEGLSVKEALQKACPVRLRPIVMTSLATVVGAIPEALAFGPGAETRVPMALAIIGGVTVSTLLTLFVVPCVYSTLSRFERKQVLELEFSPA